MWIFAMPFTDSKRKKQYHRDYMRQRRKGLTGESTGLSLNSESETMKFDPTRPHVHRSIKIAGTWRRVAEQDGRIYDRDSGELLRLE
ncbi:MAG: hypothetical protein ABSE08_02635 [Syntrophobacteraceae bacterium]